MAEKLFYTMGEVAEMFDVRASLLRHWETQFPQLRPTRNKKGNRLYTSRDLEILKRIYLLVKERGMTLDGAKRTLRQQRGGERVDRDAELLERLQRIRSLLAEVREELKEGVPAAEDGAVRVVPGVSAAASPAVVSLFPVPAEERESAGADYGPAYPAEPVPAVPSQPFAGSDSEAAGDPEEELAEDVADRFPGGEQSAPRRARRRRKGDDPEGRELFAFYEQSLF